MRDRLAPSLFFSSLLFLKLAKEATRSMTPQSLPTFLMNLSAKSHLEPKLEALRVSVSFVCDMPDEVTSHNIYLLRHPRIRLLVDNQVGCKP